MKIALDARWIFPEISGVGAYTRELIRQFTLLNPPHEFFLIFQDRSLMKRTAQETGFHQHPRMHGITARDTIFAPAGQFRFAAELVRLKPDVYHSPNYMIPLLPFPRGRRGAIAAVTTIHDLIPLVLPQHAPRSRKSRLFPLYRWLMQDIARRSDAIITVSEWSKRDIVQHLAVPDKKADNVHVVYNGVAETFRPAVQTAAAGDKIQTHGHTLLYVGRSDPYKNLTGLVSILAGLCKETKLPVRLRIAGTQDPRYPESAILAGQLGIADRVEWTGYLTHEQLITEYQRADLLVHASEYEGFGLQILEAMACGLPVVSSKAASLPEVAGEAAVLLPPHDHSAWVREISRLLLDSTARASLREAGFRHAAQFTWRRAAQETLHVYETVMRTP